MFSCFLLRLKVTHWCTLYTDGNTRVSNIMRVPSALQRCSRHMMMQLPCHGMGGKVLLRSLFWSKWVTDKVTKNAFSKPDFLCTYLLNPSTNPNNESFHLSAADQFCSQPISTLQWKMNPSV